MEAFDFNNHLLNVMSINPDLKVPHVSFDIIHERIKGKV